jgi:hypothetical protein
MRVDQGTIRGSIGKAGLSAPGKTELHRKISSQKKMVFPKPSV